MKKTSKTLATTFLLKPAALTAVYALATRIGDATGCRLNALEPLGDGVSQLTGMTCASSTALAILVIGFVVLQIATAACTAILATSHR